MHTPTRAAAARDWAALGAFSALIFATVPFARGLQKWVVAHAGEQAFLVAVLCLLGVAAALGWRAFARPPLRARLAIALGALVYASAAFRLRGNAVEAVHIVEYGVFGGLALRALASGTRDRLLAPSAALLGLTVGLIDEGLQWLAPDRVWDLRDIGVNALAAAGAPALLVFGVGPAWSRARASRAGARRLWALSAVAWGLLGASLLNTSARVARFAEWLPTVRLIAAQDAGMIDYGVRHELPGIGAFPSRLAAAQWAAADAARFAEAGASLAADASSKDEDAYAAFLALHSAVRDPFLHELRVHLFRRDRYAETAEWHRGDPAWRAKDLDVARREDAFLARFAPKTLAAAGLAWSDARRAELAALALPGPYASRVAESVVTRLSERSVAGVWAAGFIALALTRRRASSAPRN